MAIPEHVKAAIVTLENYAVEKRASCEGHKIRLMVLRRLIMGIERVRDSVIRLQDDEDIRGAK